MIGIIDYGVGNLFSLKSSLASQGLPATLSGDPEVLFKCDQILLPGVGAFGDAAEKLRSSGLQDLILDRAGAGVPLLGICLGMQLLFDESTEYGTHPGLSLIPGRVTSLEGRIPADLKIPHIGWNSLHFGENRSPLFRDLCDGDYVYFVHSYSAVDCKPYVSAETEYGSILTAAAEKDNIFGCQFHPEKSGEVGLKILRAFGQL